MESKCGRTLLQIVILVPNNEKEDPVRSSLRCKKKTFALYGNVACNARIRAIIDPSQSIAAVYAAFFYLIASIRFTQPRLMHLLQQTYLYIATPHTLVAEHTLLSNEMFSTLIFPYLPNITSAKMANNYIVNLGHRNDSQSILLR